MHRMRHLLAALVLLSLVAASLAVSAASAKEGVVARVVHPIDRAAPPGERLRVVWDLFYVEDGRRQAFGGGAVFIQLIGGGTSRSRRAYGAPIGLGRYRGTVTVPRGGIRRVVIGLMGTRCDASGCRASPMLFPIVGDPFRKRA
jgi:hypothetical protein